MRNRGKFWHFLFVGRTTPLVYERAPLVDVCRYFRGIERGFYVYVAVAIGVSLVVYATMRDTRDTSRIEEGVTPEK